MERISKVTALKDHRLYLEFTDGVKGEIDLSQRLFGPMFEPHKDPEFFSQVAWTISAQFVGRMAQIWLRMPCTGNYCINRKKPAV
jgi:hypothetical protein